MTNSETIKILNTVLFFGKCDLPNEHAKECLKTAIQAVEKQIPKKPIKVGSGVHDYDYDYECPMCRENIDEDEHHCKCGQAIDWSDEE